MSDVSARAILQSIVGGELTDSGLTLLQAQARGESGYGSGWGPTCGGAGVGSNNWGAIQVACGSSDPHFVCTDTHEHGEQYVACFRRYPSPEAGAAAFVREVKKRRRAWGALVDAWDDDPYAFAKGLRESHYYEAPLSRYVAMLQRNIASIRRTVPRAQQPLFNRIVAFGAIATAAVAGTLAARRFARV